MPIAVKRVYEKVSQSDGARVLVDRLWPRGLSKTQAQVDEWLRKLAPSHELRKWFHAQPGHWLSFRKMYLKELSRLPEADTELQKLYALAHKKKRLTLLFASKNETHNNSVVLKEMFDRMRHPSTGGGPSAVHAMRKPQAA